MDQQVIKLANLDESFSHFQLTTPGQVQAMQRGVETGAVAVLHSCYSDVGITGVDRTSHCIRTSIALSPLPGVRWMDGGKTSGMRDYSSIRFTN